MFNKALCHAVRGKKEIVVISPHCNSPDSSVLAGGIGTHVYEIYSSLPESLKPAILLLTCKSSDRPPGIDTVYIPLVNLPFFYLISFHITALGYLLIRNRGLKAGAVHVHYMEMALLPALLTLLLGINIVVTFHGYLDYNKYPVFMRPVMRLTWKVLEYCRAGVVVLSGDSYTYHKKLCSTENVRLDVVGNGFIGRQVVEKIRETKRDHKQDSRVIIFTGRLSPEKNVKELINAFIKLEDPEYELWIVGDGPERARLESQAGGSEGGGKIKFWGWQPRSEVYRLLSEADIYVLPSIFEGVPIALLEAYSFGLKCVCVRNPFTETIPNITLLASAGWQEIKSKIVTAAESEAEPDMDFVSQMSWGNAAKCLEKVYQKIM
ncbi:glycosyltransferase family 4 protein [Pelotomaculum propionicicum]|uniref:glycosyltransferase family 4 protein n=1 Tax=Pelotomaculum propionicicum TaxID=258475 RepID=UPI003B7F49EA